MLLVRFLSAAVRLCLEILAGLFARLVVIGIVAVILFYLLELWIGNVPPLIADLKGTLLRRPLPNQAAVFNERLQATFPSGMPEAELEHELTRQGFEINTSIATGRIVKWASYYTGDVICITNWSVGWRADAADNIVEVWGSRREGCL